MKKWFLFLKERFDPLSHLTMILVFLFGHILFARAFNLLKMDLWQYFVLGIGVTFFFLKLRFYDEIKDYEVDLKFNPHHPLPRGLVSHKNLYWGIGTCITLELLCFSLCSFQAFLFSLVAIGYSLLMFKEFYIGKKLRPHLTTYAVSHTVVTVLLSLTIFSALTSLAVYHFPQELFYFAIVSWLLFNIFEFGRKSYLPEEERKDVLSYSKIFTRWGAHGLVLSQSLLATYLLLKVPFWTNSTFGLILISFFLLLLIVGSFFCKAAGSFPWGKIYRAFSSFYIVLIYGSIIIYFLT